MSPSTWICVYEQRQDNLKLTFTQPFSPAFSHFNLTNVVSRLQRWHVWKIKTNASVSSKTERVLWLWRMDPRKSKRDVWNKYIAV